MGKRNRLHSSCRALLFGEHVAPERDTDVVEIPIEVGFAGYFKMEAVRPDGTRRLLADWQPNLLTDVGLELLGTSNIAACCHVGTGTSTPAFTDSTLAAWKATNSSKVGDGFYTGSPYGANGVTPPYYGWNRGTYRFAAGSATGNITEVGLSNTNTNTNMTCRALVKDGAGNPTTITVLSDEILDVTYEIRMYAPSADATYNVTISGTVYTFTVRACAVGQGNYWGWPIVYQAGYNFNGAYGFNSNAATYKGFALAAVTAASPTGTTTGSPTSSSVDAYASGTRQRDFTLTWSTAQATDAAGVSGFTILTTRGYYQIGVSPTIPKNSTNNLSIKFRVSWARYP